jgi:hypothetical protein
MAICFAILSSTGSAKALCSPTPSTALGGQIMIFHGGIVNLTGLTNSPERLTSKCTQGSPDRAKAGADLNLISRVAATRSLILGVDASSRSTKRENTQFETALMQCGSDVSSEVAELLTRIFDSVSTLNAEAQVTTNCHQKAVSSLAGFVNLYLSNIKPV